MDLGLKDKTAIVTGGARGIGAAIVRELLLEGARVAIVDKDRETAEALASELPEKNRVLTVICDLTHPKSCNDAVEQTRRTLGPVDIIINNAGVNDSAGLDSGPEAFRDSLKRNLFHAYDLLHAAVNDIRDHAGCVINIGSKVATTGQGGTSGYAAAKGALEALTREWALELAPYGARCNAVIPAEVMTPMYEDWLAEQSDPDNEAQRIQNAIPLGKRWTTPEEIATAVVFLASGKSSHTTGQILYVDGGYAHLDRRCTLDGSDLK